MEIKKLGLAEFRTIFYSFGDLPPEINTFQKSKFMVSYIPYREYRFKIFWQQNLSIS